jgi:hypothetical protein
MAIERPNLTGPWRSRYEYGEGKSSEHIVDLRQDGLKVNGSSRPDPTGSELFLHLLLRGNSKLWGEWDEHTSPRGEYRGQKFHGALYLILKDEATRAEGLWLGPNRDDSHINTGKWTLEKQTDEDTSN